MLLIRDFFRCKPGKARALAEKFKATLPSMQQEDGVASCRVMLDLVASYWTVVLETETEDLDKFAQHLSSFRSKPEVQQAMEGYMELVEEGHREIYTIV